MAKYQFRLETLRRLRIAHRDQRRASLAEAYRAEEVLSERKIELASEQTALRSLQQTAYGDQYLDVNRLVEAQRYEAVLQAREKHLADQSAQLAIEVERRRLSVVEADRAVRVLDKLDERHKQYHRREASRREGKQLDEAAVNRWQR